MKNGRSLRCRLWWIALGALAAGCQMQEESVPAVRRPGVKSDPCAERLHDLCGELLLYHSIHKRLPEAIEELRAPGSTKPPLLVCPLSGKPYVYSRDGLHIPRRSGRLVLYDPQPSHSGMRWGILVDDPGSDKPLTARVVLLAEESVSSAGRQPRP